MVRHDDRYFSDSTRAADRDAFAGIAFDEQARARRATPSPSPGSQSSSVPQSSTPLAHGRREMKMIIRLVAAATSIVVATASSSLAQHPPAHIDVPAVPANLEVPEGHTLFFAGRAEGTQNYICLATANGGVAWFFLGPQATLFTAVHGDLRRQLTTHFLSANPDENNLARPTWQHSQDSSRVWGRVVASSADPQYVAEGAIPWLLLQTAGLAAGPDGHGVLTQTTFIQRVNTIGGRAPASDCSSSTQIGTYVLVPYRTDYFFYRAALNR